MASKGYDGIDPAEVVTATKVLVTADSGSILFLNSATEFTTTLPLVASLTAGWNVEFVVTAAPSGANYVITENASDTDVIITNGIAELEVDTSDDGPSNTGHTNINFIQAVAIVGDWVRIRFDGTNFFATGQTAADGGITLT